MFSYVTHSLSCAVGSRVRLSLKKEKRRIKHTKAFLRQIPSNLQCHWIGLE